MRYLRHCMFGALLLTPLILTGTGCSCGDVDLISRILNAFVSTRDGLMQSRQGIIRIRTGDTITIDAVEINRSSEPADKHHFDLRLLAVASDSSLTEVGVPLTLAVSGLGGGDSVAQSGSFTASEAGTYVVKAIADALDQLCEDQEGNNTDNSPSDSLGASLRIEVTGPALGRPVGSPKAALLVRRGRP